MRKIVASSLLAVALGLVPAHAHTGCVSAVGAGPQLPVIVDSPSYHARLGSDCSAVAARDGGFVAAGDWRVEVTRNGAVTVHEGSGFICHPTAIQAGDHVRVFSTVFAAAGDDFTAC